MRGVKPENCDYETGSPFRYGNRRFRVKSTDDLVDLII